MGSQAKDERKKLGVAHQFGASPVKLMLLTFLIFDWLNLTSTNWQYVGPLIAKDAYCCISNSAEIKISTSWLSNLWRSPFHLTAKCKPIGAFEFAPMS